MKSLANSRKCGVIAVACLSVRSKFEHCAALPVGSVCACALAAPSMIATPEIERFTAYGPSAGECAEQLTRTAQVLRESFGVAFTLWDAASGELALASEEQPGSNDPLRGQLARALLRGTSGVFGDEGCVVLVSLSLT